MANPNRTFSFRALVVGACAMVFMAIWVQFHEVLVPSANILAENSPPAGAVGIFVGLLLCGALLSLLSPRLRLAKGELLVIYSMLVIAAPLMSQGMWHRFLGLVVSIPRSQDNMAIVDAYSEKLWPHGEHLLANRRFEQGLDASMLAEPADHVRVVDVPESQVGRTKGVELRGREKPAETAKTPSDADGKAAAATPPATGAKVVVEKLPETTFRMRIPRRRDGREILVPGERYYVTALFRLEQFKSATAFVVELQSDVGTRADVVGLRGKDTTLAYSRPGGFQRAGEPFVDLPRDVKEYVDVLFTLIGTGRVTITDVNFFSNEAVGRCQKGTSEVATGAFNNLKPEQQDQVRDALLLRPDSMASPGGLWYTLKGYIPWEQWWRPLLYWSSIVFAMFLCLLAIGVIFRKQWSENERFAFPLVVLPRLLLEEKTDGTRTVRPLLRSLPFQIGAGLAFLYCLFLGLAYYIPGMPNPAVSVNLVEYFSSPAMRSFTTGMNSGTLAVSLLFASIAFFIELDMLLSILVIMWLCKIPYGLGEVFGWKTIRGPVDNFPFPHEQHIGAFMCLALLVLWASRKHLKGVWLRVLGRPGGVDDSREAMSYRAAVILILTCVAFFCVWGVMTGLGWAPALIFFGFLVVCGLSASRIRTECGAPATYFTPYYPYLLFFILGGVEFFGTRTMLLTYIAGGFMAVAQFLMFAPSQVEMLHLADTEGCQQKGVKWGLIVGALGGILLGGYVVMVWCYGKGGDNIPYMQGWGLGQNWYFQSLRNTVQDLDRFSQNPAAAEIAKQAYSYGPGIAVGIGAVVTLVLALCRTFFTGFWLHPIGYILGNSHFVSMCWGSLFAAWLVKWIALKVAGPKFIRDTMTPVFAGIFCGAIGGMLFWDIVSLCRLARGITDVYTCFP